MFKIIKISVILNINKMNTNYEYVTLNQFQILERKVEELEMRLNDQIIKRNKDSYFNVLLKEDNQQKSCENIVNLSSINNQHCYEEFKSLHLKFEYLSEELTNLKAKEEINNSLNKNKIDLINIKERNINNKVKNLQKTFHQIKNNKIKIEVSNQIKEEIKDCVERKSQNNLEREEYYLNYLTISNEISNQMKEINNVIKIS